MTRSHHLPLAVAVWLTFLPVLSRAWTSTCMCDARFLEALHDEQERHDVFPHVDAKTISDGSLSDTVISANGGSSMSSSTMPEKTVGDRELAISKRCRQMFESQPLCVCTQKGGREISGARCCCKKISKKSKRHLNQVEEPDYSFLQADFKPWATPNVENKVLLAENPGIWMFPEFLTQEELSAFHEAIKASEKFFWDCKTGFCPQHPEHDFCLANPRGESLMQPEGKQCTLVTDKFMNWLEPKYQDVFSDLRNKFKAVWPAFDFSFPLSIQFQESKTEPFKFHIDGDHINKKFGIVAPVSMVLYLTGGGSPTIFPHANVTGLAITPVEGMAITFFNADQHGRPLYTSVHGVQASPESSDHRLIVSNMFSMKATLDEESFQSERFLCG